MGHWQMSREIAWKGKGRNTSIQHFAIPEKTRKKGKLWKHIFRIYKMRFWCHLRDIAPGKELSGRDNGRDNAPFHPKWPASSSRSQDTKRSERKGPAHLLSLMLSVPTLWHHRCCLCHCCRHRHHHHHSPLTSELTFFDSPLSTGDLWFSKNPTDLQHKIEAVETCNVTDWAVTEFLACPVCRQSLLAYSALIV